MNRDLCRYCRKPLATKEDVERESDEPGLCWSIVDYCETDAETAIDAHLATIARLEGELAAERALPANLLDVHAICDQRDKATEDLHRERALADRLAGWMEDHRKNWQWHKVDPSCDCEDCVFLVPFDEALAAWKGARNETR